MNIINYPTLYKRTKTGSIQTWYMQLDTNTASIRSVSGKLDGAEVISGWDHIKGKNIGKSNETSDLDQAKKKIQQKYDKQLSGKYHESMDSIDSVRYIEPMLAKKFVDRLDKVRYPVIVQRKYNGARYIRSAPGAFSREGNQFHNTKHIIKATEELFTRYPDLVLDGEIYSHEHRKDLNRLMSVVAVTRKAEDLTPELIAESERIARYHVYDGYGFNGITEKTPYTERQAALNKIISGVRYLEQVPSFEAETEEEVFTLFKGFCDDEYEGAIIRLKGCGYQHGRSANLLKLKSFEDGEFKIIRFEDAIGHWKGSLKKVWCEVLKTDGTVGEFAANVRGYSREHLSELLLKETAYVGKMVTVEYQQLSEYGIPQIPYTNLVVRDYE